MSSAGQLIGGGVGGIAGFFSAGPAGAKYGAQIGTMLGGIIDPPKGPDVKGPRLDDLSVQTSTYGAVIPRTYGTTTVFGNIFWLENNQIKEIAKKKKSGGKGGGSKTTTTTYSYFATFALGLCEGPIVAIRRIWIGGKLLYDAGTTDQGAMRVSNQTSTLFTLYTGTDTQTADPRMQATLGVGNVPGYRGLAYMVFNDLPLADYGNTLMGAQIKVEVVSSGSIASYSISSRLMPVSSGTAIWFAIAWNGRRFVAAKNIAGGTQDLIATSDDGVTWTINTNSKLGTGSAGIDRLVANSKIILAAVNSTDYFWYSKDGNIWATVTLPSSSAWSPVWDGEEWMAFPRETTGQAHLSPDGLSWTPALTVFSPAGSFPGKSSVAGNGTVFIAVKSLTAFIYKKSTGVWKNVTLPGATSYYRICWNPDDGFWLVMSSAGTALSFDNGDTWTPYSAALPSGEGFLIWTGTAFYANDKYSVDGINWTTNAYPGLANIYDACWNGAVITVVGDDSFHVQDCYTITPATLTQSQPTLANVVQAELLKSNLLAAGDIDVTALASQTVRGYSIASVAAIRSGLEPLQAAWPFDAIQAGYKIKFVKRGGASIATVSASELDARSSGGSPGVSITNVREMDIVLPRKVRVLHVDYEREYDAGEQYAERLNTDAVNVRSVELAIVLTAAEAAGMAEVLLYLAWLERYDVSLSLPPIYNHLEPADVITVNASEGQYELRLTSVNYTQDGRVECQAKYNSAATYAATALGVAGAVTESVLSETGQTAYVVLDIPTIIDTTDTPGVVVAMAGYAAGWNGSTLFKSDDGGQIWTDLQGTAAPGTTMGFTGSALATGRTDIIDNASTLTVTMIEGTLSSVSELSMLNGANWFAIGDHGRWEVVAAKTCTLVSGTTYTVSDFLRGRYGTEWAMSLHQIGDWIVQLDGDTAAFVNYPLSAIGTSHYYRGITNGQAFDSDADRIQPYTGVALECLSPAYLNGNQDPISGDWSMEWLRRTRIGGEWKDLIDAPLSEASESYVIEIYTDGTYATIKRTLTSSTPNVVYTLLQQLADFGSLPVTLYLKIYQVSANVGPGYPLTASLTGGGSVAALVNYLVVAGGGGGGAGSPGVAYGGSGGAGGLLMGNELYSVLSGSTISLTVGAGGSAGASGSDSVYDTLTVTGGGRGGIYTGIKDGANGGSGGGVAWLGTVAGTGVAGQGHAGSTYNSGGAGGGGGGAGASATTNIGGAGFTSSISGASVTYATGGSEGGAAGAANTGDGGGSAYVGYAGGSGIVIVRYSDYHPAASSTTGSPSIVVAGGFRTYTWTTAGAGSITFA